MLQNMIKRGIFYCASNMLQTEVAAREMILEKYVLDFQKGPEENFRECRRMYTDLPERAERGRKEFPNKASSWNVREALSSKSMGLVFVVYELQRSRKEEEGGKEKYLAGDFNASSPRSSCGRERKMLLQVFLSEFVSRDLGKNFAFGNKSSFSQEWQSPCKCL